MSTSLQVSYLLLAPLLAIGLTQHSRIARLLGPVVFAYLFGMLLPRLPLEANSIVTTQLRDLSIPLAIPLLLFSLDLRGWLSLARPAAFSFGLCLLALLTACSLAWLLFSNRLAEAADIAGMLAGVYSGGTPNMAVIHRALGAPPELFLQINSIDVLISGAYFLFLVSLAGPVYGLWLRPYAATDGTAVPVATTRPSLAELGGLAQALLASLLMLAFSAGLVTLLWGQPAIAPVLLLITSLAIAASFWPRLHNSRLAYPAGYYLVLVFCCAIGSQVDLSLLGLGIASMAAMVALVFALTVALHLGLCRLAGIDRDTAIITQTAALFGPPFVPPVAGALRNPAILLSGLTTGLVGYALGNYLGLAMAWLFRAL